jgi:MFS family permease
MVQEALPVAEKSFRVYGYRWVVLAAFMLVNLAIQMLWICFAPITGPAAKYYGVTDLSIGLLAMSFMFIYVPISMPVSWLIDKLGYYKAVGLGSVLMAVFALLRGFVGSQFTWVMVCTLGIAIAQPFILNAVSTVAAKWFPLEERATASGLALVANFIGIALGEVVTPGLFLQYGIPVMLKIYGVIACVAAVIFIIFTREAPPTPPGETGQSDKALVLGGLKEMMKMPNIWLLLVLFLVGMGVFNGISTWIEDIVRPRGFSITDAGNLGGALLLGGIIGAAIFPLLSDKLHRRKIFLQLGLLLAIPGLIGSTYSTSVGLMMASMFVLGFFLMGLAPIGYQYAAEITRPAPEGTSNGLLNLAGQASVVFIYGMEAMKAADGSFTPSLLIMVVMMAITAGLMFLLTESTMMAGKAVEKEV